MYDMNLKSHEKRWKSDYHLGNPPEEMQRRAGLGAHGYHAGDTAHGMSSVSMALSTAYHFPCPRRQCADSILGHVLPVVECPRFVQAPSMQL